MGTHLSSIFVFDFSNGKVHPIPTSSSLSKWPNDRAQHGIHFDMKTKELIIYGGEHLTGTRDGVWTCDISHIFSMFNLGKSETDESYQTSIVEVSKTTMKNIEKANKKLKDSPNDIPSLLLRCESYCDVFLLDKCLADVETIKQLDPDNLDVKIYEAICFFQLSEYKKSLKIFKELTSKKDIKEYGADRYESILVYLAKGEAFIGNYTSAVKYCDELLDHLKKNKKMKDNDAFDAYHVKAESLFCLNKYEESIQIYDDAIKNFKSGSLLSGNFFKTGNLLKTDPNQDLLGIGNQGTGAFLNTGTLLNAGNLLTAGIFASKKSPAETFEDLKNLTIQRQKNRVFAQDLLKDAQKLMDQGNDDKALELYEKITQLDPESAIGYAFISEIYLKRRNFETSKEFAKKCIENDRKYWKGYHLIASCYILVRNTPKCIAYLEEGLKRCGHNDELQKSLDDAEKKKEIYEKASEFARTGENYLSQLMIAEAIEELDHAIQLDSENSNYYSIRSQAHLELKHFDKALEDALNAIKIDPLTSIGYLAQAEVLVKQKKYTEAVDLLEKSEKKIVDVESKKVVQTRLESVQQLLASYLSQEKNYKKALLAFEKYDKTVFQIVDNLKENTAVLNKKLTKILSLVESARKWDAEVFVVDSVLLCAKISYQMKKFSDTIEDCNEIISHDPLCEDAHILLALCYASIHLQQFSKSLETLKNAKKVLKSSDRVKSTIKLVEESEKNFKSFKLIIDDAHVLRQAEKYEKAIETYKKALLFYPQVNTMFELAFCQYQSGKYQESITNCEMALAQEPEFPHINNLLALNHLKLKKYEEALKITEKALKFTPFNSVLNQTWSTVKLQTEMRKIEVLEESLEKETTVDKKIELVSGILVAIPNSIKYLLFRSSLYILQQNYSKAARDCKKIFDCGYSGGITPKQIVETDFNYATCYYYQKRYAKAFIHAERAAKKNFGSNYVNHTELIKLLTMINQGENETKEAQFNYEDAKEAHSETQYERALELITKAIEINPKNELYHVLASKINLELNKDQALIDAKTVLDLNPFEPDNIKLLVSVYVARFEYTKALEDLDNFLSEETDKVRNSMNLIPKDVIAELNSLKEDVNHCISQQRKAKENHVRNILLLLLENCT
jgi:tetratricopeptide (TPR) repeat protein